MFAVRILPALSALMLSATPLAAQPTPPAATPASPAADGPEVVVTGVRDQQQAIRDFVGALTPDSINGHIDRFETSAICPTAIGVPPSQKVAIAKRLRQVATAAGIAVAPEKCVPNVLAIVTSDKRAFLNALAKRHNYLFGGRSSSEVGKLIGDPSPAVAWQVGGPPVTADGSEVAYYASEGAYVNRTGRTSSRLAPAAHPQFAAAVVVVEARALDGLTVTQLADYVAMRGYARTDPAKLGGLSAPTILKVLETPMGSPVPLTLTTWDLGFLRALYANPPAASSAGQRSSIRRQLGKELERSNDKD